MREELFAGGERVTSSIAERIEGLDWAALEGSLDALGHAVTPPVLAPEECAALAALFDDERHFRKTVDLGRHRFGEGRYRYFSDPVPETVRTLREALYPPLAAVANRWWAALRIEERFPGSYAAYERRCREAGQAQPTPLILDYGAGDYNCLHQDVYGEMAFPLQATCMLSAPGEDFTGGEFLLVEQRPRAQSRGEAVALAQGALVLFPNGLRPVEGKRGHYRVRVRHGVSRVRSGHRRTLGVIFHGAR